ncbi:MAG: sulfite exporter TauE/SafE family protein [Alphaproteobacteria bacterium]|nr:sulfite exporter TauE/SafE family protein [Alphaproteobacteria bacterium]
MSGAEPFVDPGFVPLIALIFFALALLYSSVGHAGASGYLAVMALFGIPADLMRPVALSLNILVASLTVFRFHKSGHLSWSDIWPVVLFSVPLAFLGGSLSLPPDIYRPVLGTLLLISAAYLLWSSAGNSEKFSRGKPRIPRTGAFGLGGGIGLLSGLTGIGGGVLLSPSLLVLGWTGVRRTSAIAACFILFNSTAGLAGNVLSVQNLPIVLPLWAGAALAGGFIGSRMGANLLATKTLVRLLSLVLIAAGIKFLLT